MSSSVSDTLRLTPELTDLVNGALSSDNPLVLAVVNEQGHPRLSFRGSVQVLDEERLGLWVRNGQGETLTSIKRNPNVALMYRSSTTPMIQFFGRARIAEDPSEREKVYNSAPERERNSDPQKKGVAIVIDLDKIEGVLRLSPQGPEFINMKRM